MQNIVDESEKDRNKKIRQQNFLVGWGDIAEERENVTVDERDEAKIDEEVSEGTTRSETSDEKGEGETVVVAEGGESEATKYLSDSQKMHSLSSNHSHSLKSRQTHGEGTWIKKNVTVKNRHTVGKKVVTVNEKDVESIDHHD